MKSKEKIDYKKILTAMRLRHSSQTNRTILTESESDRGRVLFSPAFRRLQQKAQVFSMEPNAAVRSRLTHSLEVSQIGRYIGDEIGAQLFSKNEICPLEQGALVNFIETACLIHDIGNPPFGHFGEAAIQQWFEANGETVLFKSIGSSKNDIDEKQLNKILSDFIQFDGNPQGFRIVTRLQWNTDEFGLNLTATTLASFLKYLRSPYQSISGLFTKKPGFFFSEENITHEIWKKFGIDSDVPRRFPLNYIMEAADDIAYCISDLEDSIEKGIVNAKQVFPEIKKEYNACGFTDSDIKHKEILEALESINRGKSLNGTDYTYTDFRTSLNRMLVNYTVEQYLNNEESIALGKLETLLPEGSPPGAILKVLKDYCRKHVYTHLSVQRIELAGYTAIFGLLNHCKCLLELSKKDFLFALEGKTKGVNGKRLLIEPKLLSLFPIRHILVYKKQLEKPAADISEDLWEWNSRAHLVVDFISGMTDDFAMTTYRNLAGMRL